jgi:hypothetical protein
MIVRMCMAIRRCVAYRNDLRGTMIFDLLEIKYQDPTKVIAIRDTPPYGHAPTYQISLTYMLKQIWKTVIQLILKNAVSVS